MPFLLSLSSSAPRRARLIHLSNPSSAWVATSNSRLLCSYRFALSCAKEARALALGMQSLLPRLKTEAH